MVVSPSCPPAMSRQEWSIEDFEIKKKLYEGAISRVLLAKDKRSGTYYVGGHAHVWW